MFSIVIKFDSEVEMNKVAEIIKKIDDVNYVETYINREVRQEYEDLK